MAVIGDTVKIRMKFTDFSGLPADPTEITLNVYSQDRVLIEAIIVDLSHTKVSTGIYDQPYVIPEGNRVIYYEVIGNPEGLPSVMRGKIECFWAVPKGYGCCI